MIIIVTGRGVNTTRAVASIPGVCAHILTEGTPRPRHN